jgi:formylglycine-generating enzyme
MKNTKLLVITSLMTASLPAAITIDWVDVGYAGNTTDSGNGSLYGAVAYDYKISKYEVTNSQYAEFLNAADPTGANTRSIYYASMTSSARGGIDFTSGAADGAKYTVKSNFGDKPVNFVTWYASARFTNWLHNGQGAGSTETGAYVFTTTTTYTKNAGVSHRLPNENEWYKAAYYDPTVGAGGGDNYWAYATQSDTLPTVAIADVIGFISNPGSNVANYNFGADWNDQDGNVTAVGSALANNFFGTQDMSGNVAEYLDADTGLGRRRGGSYLAPDISASGSRFTASPFPIDSVGFRVVMIPEPSALLLTALSMSAALCVRRRNSV